MDERRNRRELFIATLTGTAAAAVALAPTDSPEAHIVHAGLGPEPILDDAISDLEWPRYEEILEQGENLALLNPTQQALIDRFKAVYNIDFFDIDPSNNRNVESVPSQTSNMLAIKSIYSNMSLEPSSQIRTLRPQHVEILLEQAYALLDRALVTKNDRDDKAARAAVLAMDLWEFLLRDRTHRDEVAAGAYTLAFRESVREWKNEKLQRWAVSIKQRDAEQWLEKSRDASSQHDRTNLFQVNASGVIRAAEAGGYMGMQPHIVSANYPQGTKENSFLRDMSPFPLGSLEITQDTPGRIAGHSAAAHKSFELLSSYWRISTERWVAEREGEAARHRVARAAERTSWHERNLEFLLQRHAISIEMTMQKIAAAIEPGGSLNFSEQERDARNRFKADFGEALTRIVVVAKGMHTIYGYTVPLPPAVVALLPRDVMTDLDRLGNGLYGASSDNSGDATAFNAAVEWTRAAMSWLVAYRQFDRRYIAPFQLSKVLEGGLGSIFDTRGGTFDLHRTSFAGGGDNPIRLNGIGLEVVGQTGGYWQAELISPRMSIDVDSADLPIVRIGLVAPYSGTRYPVFSGVDVLHNRNPVGRWTLKMSEGATDGSSRTGVSDVVFYLDVTLNARKTGE